MKFGQFFPVFNRPEYPKNPEAFQSAMAWSLIDTNDEIKFKELVEGFKPGKPIGLIYKKIHSIAKNINLVETWPSSTRLKVLSKSLSDAGIRPNESVDMDFVSRSLLKALEGVKADNAKGYAAAPITRAAAYLQNPVGVHTKEGPPNFARIIEQIYEGGKALDSDSMSAASGWLAAISGDAENQFDRAIEAGIAGYLAELGPGRSLLEENSKSPLEESQPRWLRESSTPLRWFNTTWQVFCQPEWRTSLAGRRWSDWASCILRTGISMAFLWESRFYQTLGKLLLAESLEPIDASRMLLHNSRPLLDWHEPELAITVRDQNSGIISSIRDGYSVRSFLDNESDVLDRLDGSLEDIERWQSADGFGEFISMIHRALSESDKKQLEGCFQRTPGGANNTIETVQYSLGTRQETGKHADFYGLLARRSRRFLVVQPGEEWIVVIASMCAKLPGDRTVLRNVRKSLSQLGIGVSREILVSELERAGLTSSSHDADDAIEVWAGF